MYTRALMMRRGEEAELNRKRLVVVVGGSI
jgi:hypothetical protein